jgi:hypothetical protein
MQDKFSKYKKAGVSKLDKYKKSKGATLSKAEKETELGIKARAGEVEVNPTPLGNVLIGILLVANIVVWVLAIIKLV